MPQGQSRILGEKRKMLGEREGRKKFLCYSQCLYSYWPILLRERKKPSIWIVKDWNFITDHHSGIRCCVHFDLTSVSATFYFITRSNSTMRKVGRRFLTALKWDRRKLKMLLWRFPTLLPPQLYRTAAALFEFFSWLLTLKHVLRAIKMCLTEFSVHVKQI